LEDREIPAPHVVSSETALKKKTQTRVQLRAFFSVFVAAVYDR